jgi:hypothetical protein
MNSRPSRALWHTAIANHYEVSMKQTDAPPCSTRVSASAICYCACATRIAASALRTSAATRYGSPTLDADRRMSANSALAILRAVYRS